MQERRYRPGDAVDDYCPRERRITDHAVVAMIGDAIKRTRCAVCDAEHEYKAARVPAPRRRAEQPAALFAQVLDGLQPPAARLHAPPATVDDAAPAPVAEAGTDSPGTIDIEPRSVVVPDATAAPDASAAPPSAVADREEGPVRRPLIRAQFPKREGQEPTRNIPEFTVQSLRNRGRQGPGRGRHGAPFGHGHGAGTGGDGAGRSRGRRRRRHKHR
jgi:hypothetical protein